ncbi:hypothetical protein P8452_21037 [Trifolium repens]|nr:hypothetical protein P8452_21037 [Trifolium repens]
MLGFTSKIPIIWLLPLFILSTIFQRCNSTTNNTQLGSNCNGKDLSALLIFKLGLENHSSNTLSSWSNETDCCSWKGVLCHNITRRVTKLDLHQQYLEGEINLQSLFQIEFLSYLDLSLNGFTSISSSFNQSHDNIQYLDLSFNDDLHMDNLNWLSKISSLKSLNLSQINLQNQTNWIHSIDMHASLLELRLSSCHLTDIFPSKKHVSFANSLVTLDLSANTFDSELPSWLFDRASDMNISLLSIDGDIFWRFVANITQLNLSNNNISADLSNVTLNSDLIFMDHNKFRGGLPRISANVIYLDLSHNSFFGTISPLFCHKLGRENSLDYLDISSNLLTGEIPDCWEYWKGLSFLFMENNMLTGEVPPSMDSFIDLIILDLHNNRLSGNFSLDLSNITNLEFIHIGENNFSGPVPVKMPHAMEVMILRSNQFEGNIPPQLCSISSLIQLDLSHNKLSGPIPKCISNITGMGGAKKTSHFPFEFNLYNKGQDLEYLDYGLLRTLDLSDNNLSSEIPRQVLDLRWVSGVFVVLYTSTSLGGTLIFGSLIVLQTNSIALWLWDLLTEVRDRVHP